MLRNIRATVMMFLVLTLITGVLYPLLVTGIAKSVFASQADGSVIVRHGRIVGSRLLGQPFSAPRYFWSRPSATAPQPYDGAASAGSNLGPSNAMLVSVVRERIALLRAADPDAAPQVPVDLVTASGSGLDPHISPAAAAYQVVRVARARQLAPEQVRALVQRYTAERTFHVLGEPRVNVLLLNLALDDLR
ncbi:MAG: potassium-transporting ATPase subunit KdpC [Steroidobacteraceae bacterium]